MIRNALGIAGLAAGLAAQTSVIIDTDVGNDDLLAIDQGRFGIVPVRSLSAKILHQVLAPDFLAIGGFDGEQLAPLAKCVDHIAIDR